MRASGACLLRGKSTETAAGEKKKCFFFGGADFDTFRPRRVLQSKKTERQVTMLQETAFIKTRIQAGVLECAICGEVDHHSARALREKLDTELFLHRPRLFLLSLEHVSFMDSSGLGLILGRLNVARELACEMRLVKVNERIRTILSLAGASRLDGLFVEEDTL